MLSLFHLLAWLNPRCYFFGLLAPRESDSLSRREAMVGLSAAAFGLPRWIEQLLELALAPSHPESAKAAAASEALAPSLSGALQRICDVILPRTDTPGALDAGVPAFIHYFLNQTSEHSRLRFQEGLTALERRCGSQCGKSLSDAPKAEIERLLSGLEATLAARQKGTEMARREDSHPIIRPVFKFEGLPPAELLAVQFYLGLKWLTLTSFFTSELGSKAYDLNPTMFHGSYEGCRHPAHGGE